MENRQYLALVYSFIRLGPQRVKLLVDYFGDPEKVWLAETKLLLEVGLSKKIVREYNEYRKSLNINDFFGKMKKEKINYVTYLDSNYPETLVGLVDAPCVLYFKGSLSPKDKNAVAIVGTRKMTSYGRAVADMFSGYLGKHSVTTVSGLARGVDSQVHKSTLKVKGRTIAVLASGLNTIYPPENTGLAEEIVKSGGALISEYPLDFGIKKENFIARNRIISGLSKIVLVVEGEKKSGTLITASHAANQGKTVFAVPGPVDSLMSGAPLFLIQNGARIAQKPEDLLEELN